MSARGIMVAAGLFCVCGIMFFTGVMVGRGTAPVQFETDPLQKKLAALLHGRPDSRRPEKTKFDFYETLKHPVALDESMLQEEPEENKGVPSAVGADAGAGSPDGGGVDDAATVAAMPEGVIPEKKAMKTLSRRVVVKKTAPPRMPEIAGTLSALNSTRKVVSNGRPERVSPQLYTIQVSSFRQLADAIQRMETLKVKGVVPHRALADVGGKLWHRVRVGKFSDNEAAEMALERLEAKGIYGIIVRVD